MKVCQWPLCSTPKKLLRDGGNLRKPSTRQLLKENLVLRSFYRETTMMFQVLFACEAAFILRLGTDSPFRETSNIYDGSTVTADMAVQNCLGLLLRRQRKFTKLVERRRRTWSYMGVLAQWWRCRLGRSDERGVRSRARRLRGTDHQGKALLILGRG
jgi:hypothetical protein